MELQLLTWNINRRGASALAALEPIAKGLDVVMLQEVGHTNRDSFKAALAKLGLKHVVSGDAVSAEKHYGNVIASKHRLARVVKWRHFSGHPGRG